jgi:hypothetical protein
LAAVVVFAAVDLITAPHVDAVTPAAGSASNNASPTVSIDLPGAQKLDKLSVRLDGDDVTPIVHVSKDRLFFKPGSLDDGEHVVVLHADTPNVLRPQVDKTWRFVIDTVAPTVTLAHPRGGSAVTALPVMLRGETEPGATIDVAVDISDTTWTRAAAIAADNGIVDRATVSPAPRAAEPTPEASVTETMAGGEGGVVAPDTEPDIEPATGPEPTATPTVVPTGQATASPASSTSAFASTTPSPSPTPTVIASPTTNVSVTADQTGRFAIPLTLPDGPTKVSVTATDGAGNTFARTGAFVVDVNAPDLIVGGLGRIVRQAKPHITVIATDQAGTAKVRVRLDGEVVYERALEGQLSLPRDVLAEGRHSLLVTATDPGANVTT